MAENWEYKLAKIIKNNKNYVKIGATIGTVVRVNEDDGITDLKVSLCDGSIYLETFYSMIERFNLGDKLLFLPTEDNQEFFCIGRVKKVGVVDVSSE